MSEKLRNVLDVFRSSTVFGLGAAVSGPLVAVLGACVHVSMLTLGDGLSPAAALASAAAALSALVGVVARLRSEDKERLSDLFVVPWTEVIGWWMMEALFFYATGHQTTFPSIQWNAAFVGKANCKPPCPCGFERSLLTRDWFWIPKCLKGH